jgi:hypothetical protein
VGAGKRGSKASQDVGAASLSWRSISSWLLGYPQDALADAERALEIARESRHAGTLIYVLNFSIFPHVSCGSFAAANALIDDWSRRQVDLAERGREHCS